MVGFAIIVNHKFLVLRAGEHAVLNVTDGDRCPLQGGFFN
jgi:hypothetical protein